ANRLTRPSFASSRGFGFKFLGKMNYHRDPSDRFEEYDSTQWFTTFWLPIFPVATFKVRRDRSRWLGIPWKSGPQALERYPRNWNQILLTWIKTIGLLLVLRLTYLWLLMFNRRLLQRFPELSARTTIAEPEHCFYPLLDLQCSVLP